MKCTKKFILMATLLTLVVCTLSFGKVTLKETSAVEHEEIESGDWWYRLLEDGTAELTAYYGEKVEVEIPSELDGKKVTKLGGYGVLRDCDTLKSVVIPEGVTEIGYNTFYECTSLESITIPDSVTEIGNNAFSDCTSLESVNIPASVTKVGHNAFNGSGLKEVAGGIGIKEMGEWVFSNTDCIRNQDKIKKDGEWYCSLGDMQIKCSNWADFARKISFEPEGADWSNYSRAYIELPDGTLMLCSGEIYDFSPINGKKISYIRDWAFGNFEVRFAVPAEKDIIISEGVEYIGRRIGGFSEDYINSIVFPSSLRCIGDLAYTGSVSAESYGGSITSVTLNEGLVKIGKGAFWGQKLKSITIPSSVKEIGKFAFGYDGPEPTGPSDSQFDAVSEYFEKVPGFTVYGYPDTAAEAYAKENGFAFIALTDAEEPTENPSENPTETPIRKPDETLADSRITFNTSGEFSPILEMTKEEALLAIAKYLSAEQLSSVKAGKMPLDIRLMVKGIDESVSEADKELIAKAVSEIPDGEKLNFKVLKYIDISLGAVIDGKELMIPETDGEVTVSIELEKPANENYKIVRIHGSKAEVIDAQLDKDGKRLTFKTDKFSTYAVIYSDLASGGDAPVLYIAAFLFAGLAIIAAGTAVVIKKFKVLREI